MFDPVFIFVYFQQWLLPQGVAPEPGEYAMIRTIIAATALLAFGSPAFASTTVIDFDDGTNGTAIGSFYSALGVTFSSAEFTDNFGLAGTSGGLAVAGPGPNYNVGPGDAIMGSFSSAMSSVSIRGIDIGAAGMRLSVFDAANTLLGSSTAFGPDIGVGYFFDVTASFAGIRSFKISQDNPCCGDGAIFENLSFTNGVPEPANWAMLIAGFGLTGAVMRRRRNMLVA
jgi:hypothetical protein